MGFTPEQIKGRIKSVAKQNNADARTLMRIYMMERFLERLAQSEYRDNFIIKGGILVTAMIGVAHRSTMDIDTSMKNLNCQNNTSLTRVYRKDRYEKIKDFYDQTILLCQNLDFPEVVKTRFSSVYLAFVIATLKMIVLSEESTTEKLSHIKAIEKDTHLKTVLGKVNPKIESKSRNFIRMGLLKEQTLVCYAMLYLKYKL